MALILFVADSLGITTEFRNSTEFSLSGRKGDRLLDLLIQLSATTYVSGPAARAYLDLGAFSANGIDVEFVRYDYPTYAQRHDPFVHEVSAIDLLFAVGPDAGDYIWPDPR